MTKRPGNALPASGGPVGHSSSERLSPGGRSLQASGLLQPNRLCEHAHGRSLLLSGRVEPTHPAFCEETDMAQIYFHCSNTQAVLMDRRGTSVSDLIEACEEATSRVRSLIASASLEDWRDW